MDTSPAKTAAPPSPSAAPAPGSGPSKAADARIIIYQHSPLLYWWPVWFFAFVFAGLTYFSGYEMAIVPDHTQKAEEQTVQIAGQPQERFVMIFPKDYKPAKSDEAQAQIGLPRYQVTPYKSLGTTFLFVLLFVIFITNIQLRGLWSFAIAGSVAMLSIIFQLAGWWTIILDHLGHLSIFINLGGYLLLGVTVLGLWLITLLFLDRQMYVEFSPGLIKMRLEIGGGEMIYPTRGAVVEKQRTDVFRHWILGFGSGDLILHVAANTQPILLYNILGCDAALHRIQKLVVEQVVVSDAPAPANP